ncbi:MAG: Na+/H+ antiporter NhaC family protein [Bacteroidetes bacterium]|nr:Na+/H+ antiporter NhaC family protein [Bacteroidota bacterium]
MSIPIAKKFIVLPVLILITLQLFPAKNEIADFEIEYKKHVIADQDLKLLIKLVDRSSQLLTHVNSELVVLMNERSELILFSDGIAYMDLPAKTKSYQIQIPAIKEDKIKFSIRKWSPILSIIPPLLAIFLAIAFKEVISALVFGTLLGILFLLGMDDPFSYLRAPLVFIDTYIIRVLTDSSKISVIVFSMLIGGMVSLLIKNGSIQFLIRKIIKLIKTRRATLFTTWFLGLLIFFDDYANTLIVGNAARVITDKYKISRQKLAYIVDSTAAPVAAIALITTWIGAQLNYISDSLLQLQMDENPYSVLIHSLGYAFYPLLTLFFIIVLIRTGRDFGPMKKAEQLASQNFELHLKAHGNDSKTDNTEHLEGFKTSWPDALIPIAGLIVVAFASLYFLGIKSIPPAQLSENSLIRLISIIGHGDPFRAMLWASLFGVFSALLFSLYRRNLNLSKSVLAVVDGFKTMLIAMLILILAWTLGMVTEELHTANFLAEILGKNIAIVFLPALVFIIAAAIAFATGTSWGSMALLYPIMLPVIYKTAQMSGLAHEEIMPYFYQVVAAVLGGSVFGDHCSPISDTTIMSSMASSCNHIEHVRTQLPYALTVGAVSSVFGYVLVSVTGFSPIWSFLIAASILLLLIRFLGSKLNLNELNKEVNG